MRRIGSRAAALAVAVSLIGAPAMAGGGRSRTGSCSGPGHWRLRVTRATTTTLRVRFVVRDVDEHETWQVFLSDDGQRIYAGTRTAGDEGRFRVRVGTHDRGGRDRIAASAVDTATGASCSGTFRF